MRTYRHRQGLTQQEVAVRCGVSQQFVSEIERGRLYEVEDRRALPLAAVLRIPPEGLAWAVTPGEPESRLPQLVASDTSEQRWARSSIAPADEPDPALPTPGTSKRLAARPLLILDAGVFLARCRRCGWKSTGESTAGGAWAAFATHVCEERPA
jgi:transcriptional regulator with XRE-family HTH domain